MLSLMENIVQIEQMEGNETYKAVPSEQRQIMNLLKYQIGRAVTLGNQRWSEDSQHCNVHLLNVILICSCSFWLLISGYIRGDGSFPKVVGVDWEGFEVINYVWDPRDEFCFLNGSCRLPLLMPDKVSLWCYLSAYFSCISCCHYGSRYQGDLSI